jgi:hypothetical protein
MYAMIRRYTPKGAWDRKTLDEFKQRIEGKFVPRLQDIRGFHSYYVVNAGERDLVTIGIFEDQAGAAESSRRAVDFGKNDPVKDQLGTPQYIEGELLISREAPVTA